jgi:hypothetical protein
MKTNKEILELATKLLFEAKTRTDYSGRGMFGASAPIAFVTETRPGGVEGKLFLESTGFSYDSVGRNYVYYQKFAATV